MAQKRSPSKRELIDTGRNTMHAKRRADGTFEEMDDVGRSLSAARRRTPKKTVKAGYGDQGLADQQLAGLLMWVPAGVVFVVFGSRSSLRGLAKRNVGFGSV